MIKIKPTNYNKSAGRQKTAKVALFTFIVISILYFVFYRLTLSEKKTDSEKENVLNTQFINNINGIFWGQNIIAKIAPLSECADSIQCRKFTNTNKAWFGMTEPIHSINIEDEYLVKIRFKNENAKAGVNLVGKLSEKNKEWWEERKSLNIYSQYGFLEINADSGLSQDPVFIFSEQIQADQNFFHTVYLTIDKYGNNIGLYDAAGSLIKNINLKSLDPEKFKSPIFPDNKFYLGISAEPNATLIIDEFYGMPLKSSATEPDKSSQKAVS